MSKWCPVALKRMATHRCRIPKSEVSVTLAVTVAVLLYISIYIPLIQELAAPSVEVYPSLLRYFYNLDGYLMSSPFTFPVCIHTQQSIEGGVVRGAYGQKGNCTQQHGKSVVDIKIGKEWTLPCAF